MVMNAVLSSRNNGKWWELTVVGAIIATIVLFVVELTVHMDDNMYHLVELIHFFALSLLIIDLGMQFQRAKNKWKFVRKNLLIIISLFPLATLGMHLSRSARMLELMKTFRIGSYLTQATYVGSGVEMGLKSIRPLAKSMKLFDHLKKEITINLYEEPYCDHEVVSGIIKGVRHFADRYYHAKIIVCRKHFSDLSKYDDIEKDVFCGEKLMTFAGQIKETHDDQDFTWNVIIAKREVTFKHPQKVFGDSRIESGTIVSVFSTDKICATVENANERHWKSVIVGYHNLTHMLQTRCNSTHCIFNMSGFSGLNHNYYLFKKFGEVPYCGQHSLRVSC
ncbi:hypothetical protein K9M79_06470 [Candidatus Woesearchaeota archaeon]|nr:hypothetical protein [Candidatus Woesearchaeota archaeon]